MQFLHAHSLVYLNLQLSQEIFPVFSTKGEYNCFSDQYCESPCVPLGAVVMSLEPTFSDGSEIEFACSDQHFVNGTLPRKCMANRKWQGADIDCLGTSNLLRKHARAICSK